MSEKEQEVNRAVASSLTEAGIGRRYHKMDISLSQHGKVGEQLAEEVKGELPKLIRAGFGVFIHGAGAKAFDVQMMLCRGLILRGVGVKVVTLPYLTKLAEGQDDWMEIGRAEAIGMIGFYDETHKAGLDSKQAFLVDTMLVRMVMDGVPLLLQSSMLPKECVGWSQTLRELLEEQLAVYRIV